MSSIVLFNKPFNVLSQFTDPNGAATLNEYIDIEGVYATGRLDKDSEGLLLLTNDGRLQHRITDPKNKMSKTYWAQVEGIPEESDLRPLRDGITLKDGLTLPAKIKKIPPPANLWARNPPIRERKSVPDSWLEITLREGRNRQIRRMTAAVGYPTLRLVRYRIGSWTIDGIEPGEYRLLN